MKIFLKYIITATAAVVLAGVSVSAQPDRHDVRKGNRDFRKEKYKEAEIDYRKALIKDSTSFAANYNLGGALYKEGDAQQARKSYEAIAKSAPDSKYAADYYFNLGDAAAKMEDWQAAVDAYKESLLRNPGDLDAKENYIYAKMKLQQQQQQNGQSGQNDQNQENKDQKQNDNQQGQQNDQDQKSDDSQQPQPNITPQAAQQMLQAIQAKEKETQEKVNKEKAEKLKSKQREKNW